MALFERLLALNDEKRGSAVDANRRMSGGGRRLSALGRLGGVQEGGAEARLEERAELEEVVEEIGAAAA